MNIYIARHGENEDNAKGILNGHRDLPLTDKGYEQARILAGKIKETQINFDVVYSSPLERAYETGRVITRVLRLMNPVVHPLLIERDFGVMTGLKASQIEEVCGSRIIKGEHITYFLDPPEAETFPDLMVRAREFLDFLQEVHSENENILLTCHGDIGKMIYAEFYGLDWEDVLVNFHFGNCDLLLLSKDSPKEDVHVFEFKH
ncbi:MAG: histidine phosphatase family protein [Candidatus Pacebacteria bacterium]|nr:histidine phosphatase family protein [Candidatus Paceibacterota bacterium]MBP9772815.1 histidine phosphatase family protein [Candidatus Paceibacterota bacterium]QQR76424.1 MAG: histidine phosphatase family protein [Candidatus Nomurabacteria bacterium]